MPSTSQSYSYSVYSSSSSTNGGQPQSTMYAERSYTDNSGTTTERMHQLPGQRPVYESSSSSSPAGRRLGDGRNGNGGSGAETQNRITDVTDAEKEYGERIQDEYAKREGGA